MKKALSSILALALVLTMIQVAIISASALQEGDYTYSVAGVSPNQTAIITNYTGTASVISIPSTLGGYPVTAIGDNVFNNYTTLTSISIPTTISTIGNDVFYGCTGLTSVTIPNNVTSVGIDTFRGCTNLTNATIGSGLTSISNYMFYNCSNLANVTITTTIPNNLTSIGTYAFYYCSKLTSLIIPNSVTSIGANAFNYCTLLSSVNIPTGLTSIATNAFARTAITNAIIPDGVLTIGNGAFCYCSGLTSITIPRNVTGIGNNAFYNCVNLANAYFLGNAPTLGSSAFAGCASTFRVNYISGKTGFTNPWNGFTPQIFVHLTTPTLIASPTAITENNVTVTISYPEDATTKEYKLDSGNWTAYTSSVVLSNNYTVSARCKDVADNSSNEGTISVNNIIHPGNFSYSVNQGHASIISFNSAVGGNVRIPDTLGGYTVTAIGYGAFSDNSLITSMIIPSSVTSIGDWAFEHCTGMTSVNIPSGVALGNYAFSSSGLTSVTIPNSILSMGEFVFANCHELTSIDLGTGLTTISHAAFEDCPKLIGVTFPSNITTIGENAFNGTGLTSLSIPSNITTIGRNAFLLCNGLTTVTIPSTVTSIGTAAFSGCSHLNEILVPNNPYYSSQDGVLFNSNKTTLISYPAGKTGSYTTPESVTSIGDAAFFMSPGLTQVVINKNVTSIGGLAFGYCTALTDAYFLGNAPTMSVAVFMSCASSFMIHYLSGKTGFTNPWNGYTTQVYTLASLSARSGSTTVINQTSHFIYGLAANMTTSNFENNYIQINGNGRLVYTYIDSSFGTGTKVELVDNITNTVVQTYYIVIFGDVNGDGSINSTDIDVLVAVENWEIFWDEVTEAYNYKAGDLNGDSNIDSIDGDIIVDYMNGYLGINQVTGLFYVI